MSRQLDRTPEIRASYRGRSVSVMRPEKVIETLEDLKAEGDGEVFWHDSSARTAWEGKIRGTLASALGKDDHLIDRFDNVSYSVGFITENTPTSYFIDAMNEGVREACGVIDAAIFQLRLQTSEDEPTDERFYDPELWEHVKNLVEDNDWGKVASQTAIFVESHIRQWANDPTDNKGETLVGKGLMATVFGDTSDWRLGAKAGEREGWRALAMGFTQALGNVDRHRIQKRDDARRYAIGVLGLGSLLLTQMRFEHPELVEDATTGIDSSA